MTKTPEQMAEEYATATEQEFSLEEEAGAYKGFLAGYQAAKDEEATKDQKIAELWVESIKKMLPSVHEITLFPSKPSNDEVVAKMDAAIEKAKGNSSNNSNGWISVKERLPEIADGRFISDDVLWISRYGEMHVSCLEQLRHEIRVDWGEAGLLKLDQVTHWMPLPEAPKEEG